MDILKNPIIIGLISGTLTYAYMTWSVNEENKKIKDKKNKKEINLIIPLIVLIITWFIAYAYFEHQPSPDVPIYNGSNLGPNTRNTFIPHGGAKLHHPPPIPVMQSKSYNFIHDVVASSHSSDPKSFHLLNQGIHVPTEMPNIMIDMI